jgi:urea transport system substrate-binding protein
MMKKLLLASALTAVSAHAANAEIRVGVLHSLTGAMAISETTLRDVMLMLIEQQNAAGGLLGQQIVPVVVDPASDWPLSPNAPANC